MSETTPAELRVYEVPQPNGTVTHQKFTPAQAEALGITGKGEPIPPRADQVFAAEHKTPAQLAAEARLAELEANAAAVNAATPGGNTGDPAGGTGGDTGEKARRAGNKARTAPVKAP